MSLAKRRTPIDVRLPPYGVYVLESHHAPGFRMAAESHVFLELFFVLSGRGQFRIEGVSHPCAPGDLVVVPPGVSHAIDDNPDRPLALYAVCVAGHVVQHEPGLFGRLPVGTVRVGSAMAGETRAIFRQLLFEQTRARPFGPTRIIGLSLQLMASLGRFTSDKLRQPSRGDNETSSAERRQLIERYAAELSHRFFEHTTLDDAAVELGLSRRRFTTLFHEITGQTWADYLTGLRIDYACKLLRETSRSVVAIAFECGYEDLSSFYRAFKRQVGRSPGQWREDRRRA
jgi:AraC family L-rhamnose operon regulatory protein RhaS